MGKRILVIEDNPASLDLITYLLQAFGHEPLRARNGAEGLESALRENPDLILCDIQLPHMTGHEVCYRLKKDKETSQIPLVAVTAFAMVGDRELLLSEGFDGYISKPINPETFISQINVFINQEKSIKTFSGSTTNSKAATSPRSKKNHGRVLVVDNTEANSELTRLLLESNGFEVVVAKAVDEALDIISRDLPDLILSDIHMPEKDGFDLLEEVRADDLLDHIPFVFLTASYWGESDHSKARQLGADSLIIQPVEPEKLLSEIQSLMGSKRSRM